MSFKLSTNPVIDWNDPSNDTHKALAQAIESQDHYIYINPEYTLIGDRTESETEFLKRAHGLRQCWIANFRKTMGSAVQRREYQRSPWDIKQSLFLGIAFIGGKHIHPKRLEQSAGNELPKVPSRSRKTA